MSVRVPSVRVDGVTENRDRLKDNVRERRRGQRTEQLMSVVFYTSLALS